MWTYLTALHEHLRYWCSTDRRPQRAHAVCALARLFADAPDTPEAAAVNCAKAHGLSHSEAFVLVPVVAASSVEVSRTSAGLAGTPRQRKALADAVLPRWATEPLPGGYLEAWVWHGSPLNDYFEADKDGQTRWVSVAFEPSSTGPSGTLSLCCIACGPVPGKGLLAPRSEATRVTSDALLNDLRRP